MFLLYVLYKHTTQGISGFVFCMSGYTYRMQEFTTTSPEQTQDLAVRLIKELSRAGAVRGTSTIVALRGDLGAGKTIFVQGAARALGVDEQVTSPTFVIEKVYQLPEGRSWRHLIHIDAYRLSGEEELHTIGWGELATDPHNLIMIEWPERLGLGVPERAVRVTLEQVDERTRVIGIEGVEV